MIGNRVYIRIINKDDLGRITRWLNDPEISDIMGYLPTFSIESQNSYYDKLIIDKTRFIFAICQKENDEHIGNVGLGNIDYIHRHAMFSIFIFEYNSRYLGFGTEATRLCLDFAFNRLNLNKVYLRTSERFVSAIKMYEKIGFVKEGIMRQHYYTNGKYEDKIIYSILKSEYLKKD